MRTRRLRKPQRIRRENIMPELEVIRIPDESDRLDLDIHDHVTMFISNLKDQFDLPEIDLSTEQGAKDAVEMLAGAQERLTQQIRLARSLKRLIMES